MSAPADGGPPDGPWRSCGYNRIIERSGRVVEMLHPKAIGAHVGDTGHNHDGFGIALEP